MPAGTRVDRCFQGLRDSRGDASAARICQAATGQALATGRAPRKKAKLTPEELEAVGGPRKANSYSQDINAGRVPRNNPR